MPSQSSEPPLVEASFKVIWVERRVDLRGTDDANYSTHYQSSSEDVDTSLINFADHIEIGRMT